MADEDATADATADYAAQLRRTRIGEPPRLDGPIQLADYDPAWPAAFERLAGLIGAALDDRALRIEHVGSTSVPGLPAKPRIDIVLAVADSAIEADYAPRMGAAGYVLHIREPDWHEHRVFVRDDEQVNVHTFTNGCAEIERMTRFRDYLRAEPTERELYLRTKRELAARHWEFVQQYADAKSQMVEAILQRAGAPPPDPHEESRQR
ncbi:hypothetical protein BH23CHL7_BH23CHL7_21770 [soil metagenome]